LRSALYGHRQPLPRGRGFHEKAAPVNNKICDRFPWGIAQGGLPSCGGSRLWRRGGNHPPRLSPWGKRERGFTFFFLAAARLSGSFCVPIHFPFSPPPTRPASIRTLVWSGSLRCQLVFSIYNGCCHLGFELNSPGRRLVPPRPRSHPNSAIGNPSKSFRPLSF
jgi:hypothetical protein